jgi:hypothetical protein
LTLWGNLPEFSASPPVLESTVMLHVPTSGLDLDFTLAHGRVLLSNTKPSGPANVRVRFFQEIWDLTLRDQASEVVVELLGIHSPEGQRASQGIEAYVGLFVKGEARVKIGPRTHHLPDRGQLTWFSRNPVPSDPVVAEALPGWWTHTIDPNNKLDPNKPWIEGKMIADMMSALRDFCDRLDKTEDVVAAVTREVRESPHERNRVLGVHFLGALEAVPHLVEALGHPGHPEVRLTAAYTLRHWRSHHGASEQELRRTLDEKRYSREEAAIIVRLLHFFSEQEVDNPQTYEALVAYLNHDRLVIRELAFGHLATLVPEEAARIPYDPAGSLGQRRQACEQWKKLLATWKAPFGPVPSDRVR